MGIELPQEAIVDMNLRQGSDLSDRLGMRRALNGLNQHSYLVVIWWTLTL